MTARRLRVGVVRDLLPQTEIPSGHGRVWHETFARLRQFVDLEVHDTRRWAVWSRRARQRPDVWLTNGHSGPHFVREPTVAVVHEAAWGTDESRGLLARPFFEMISVATRDAVASADLVVAPSSSARLEVLNVYGVSPDIVRVVPYGVDTSIFRPTDPSGRAWPRTIDDPYVLFAATVHPRKNLPTLRAAMLQLARRGFPHKLVVVAGGAPDRPDSSDLIAEAKADLDGFPGRVLWVEKAPADRELAALMANAAAFCLPSLVEGFGLTALEALACGAPVVVSDRSSLPEVVGEAGIVVPPTVDGLEMALASILTDAALATRLRHAGPQRARGLTWEHTAQGWLSVLHEAARIERGTTRPRRATISDSGPGAGATA